MTGQDPTVDVSLQVSNKVSNKPDNLDVRQIVTRSNCRPNAWRIDVVLPSCFALAGFQYCSLLNSALNSAGTTNTTS